MAASTNHDLWVFGYGSLMWDPGFAHSESRSALLRGYHRVFKLSSTRSWGSPEAPGLVASLLPGGSCRGRAFRVAPGDREQVLDYLAWRERAYLRRQVRLGLDAGEVAAVTHVADPSHPRFLGALAPEQAARLIRQGVGDKGSSRDYLANTVDHLEQLGLRDGALHDLLGLVKALDGE
jgi:cation transport protein ChaC